MHLSLSTYFNALMNVDWIMHCEYLNSLRISYLRISTKCPQWHSVSTGWRVQE